MTTSVSTVLSERYGIDIRPGSKGNCPFCQHSRFSIKRDDTIGKCFHPLCGRFLSSKSHESCRTNILHGLLEKIFQDFHAHLLALTSSTYGKNAYSYLVHERKIDPQVVADSMLGVVPAVYDWASKFDQAAAMIEARAKIGNSETRYENKEVVQNTGQDIAFLIATRDKFRDCVQHRDGSLAFFYADGYQRIVAVRFREPYSKRITYFKPYETIAGLFGHGLFTSDQVEGGTPLDQHLVVTEGEFNQLQLQSLCMRRRKSADQAAGYIFSASVGGVHNADYHVISQISNKPIFCYDNDLDGAGFALVTKARATMNLEAITTPRTDSDLDEYILSFGDDHEAAWEAVMTLIDRRKSFTRTYSGTGLEFFRGKQFIPKLLGEAIMGQQHFRCAGGALWIYKDGVYQRTGDLSLRVIAQKLLGEERRENRIVETLRYLETACSVDPPVFNPRFINLRNGRLDWKSGNLESHSPDVFEIAQLPVVYDPSAECPHFDHYLETTVEPEIVPLIEEVIGHCLIADTRFEKAFLITGDGKNGKSVLLDTITSLLGEENVSNVPLQNLEESRFSAAELYGKLANISADLDDRALNSSSVFKTLVTGDRIKGERKFGQPFYFRPYARLVFSANSLPPSRDRTYAFYRRWVIIRFTRTFKRNDADTDLREKLTGESPGILNRALTGLRRLFAQDGFTEPQAVTALLQEYERENDTVASFASEALLANRDGRVEKKIVASKYRSWCGDQGLRPVGPKQFKASLKRIFPNLGQVRSLAGTGPWLWIGITLTNAA
jgi:P4 family phage/plasmid primase-like protien